MSNQIHWEFRKYLNEFREGGKSARWPLLTILLLHANQRLRCWPSTDLLMEETGFGSRKEITEARRWLISHQVIILVPYDQRVGEEKNLPERQFVYQITGVYRSTDGALIPFLNLSPEEAGSIIADIEALEGIESSVKESLVSELKGIYHIEVSSDPKKQGRRKRRDTSPTPRKVQPHIAIIDAWYDGMPTPPIQRKYPRNVAVAKTILDAGYTPEQVTAFVRARYADPFWNGKSMTLEYVQDNLPLWVKGRTAEVTPPPIPIPIITPSNPPPPPARDIWAEPDEYGLVIQKLLREQQSAT